MRLLFSLPCVKGGGTACRDGGIVKTLSDNPSVSYADSSPYTGEPTVTEGLSNGKSLYGTTCLAGGFQATIKKAPERVLFLLYY